MRRRFNITGSCKPQRHYMVKLDDRVKKIKEDYVDEGSYFVINRGRQYGKTTTLEALEGYLEEEYIVISLDFQLMGTKDFSDEAVFAKAFRKDISMALEDMEDQMITLPWTASESAGYGLKELFIDLSNMCKNSPRPIVLMIDEVDSAGNNQVFIDFLAQLRGYYLKRDKKPIFHSVILAGVYNIKNLKLKLRPESEHQYNSPWNIAADFDIDMSFSSGQIASMLEEYEADYHTGMDIPKVAEEIYQYTSGYPVLVSSICKRIDEKIAGSNDFENRKKAWSKEGVAKAVANILKESTPLFESMVKQLDQYKELYSMVEDLLYQGRKIPFSPDEKSVSIGIMFGFLTEENGHVAIANRIFEMYLLNLFMTKEALESEAFVKGGRDKSQFIKYNRLDMDLVLEKFVEYFDEIYNKKDTDFIEKYGRKFFLLYLKPIINGTGNYYIEAQTRDERRTDVIVDYLGEQFIVELKIWHGREYNERGEKQLTEYLDYYHKDKGYMLSFNFNKEKEIGVKEIQVCGKTIVEAVV
ncbi:MAG: ATP-binding protein [Lachnospiraceae bacterium]|nr:ATP-binding protein [Lachnospiraceae bacterium]